MSEVCQGIDQLNPLVESTLIISSDLKKLLGKSEVEIFNRFNEVIEALLEIRNDSKSSSFWKWKLLNEKNFKLSRLAEQIKANASYNNSRELLSYFKVNKGVGALIACCKLIRKTSLINLQELKNQEILELIKKIHLNALRRDVHNPLEFDESLEKIIHTINVCNSLVSVNTTLYWSEYSCHEKVKLLSEILIYVILALPSESDVKSYLYSESGPFKDLIGSEDELNKFLCDFDSSTILSIDLNELKAMLSNSESYLEIYNKFGILSKEDELKYEYENYSKAKS